MNLLLIIPYYLSWHYTNGILGLFSIFKNLIWFLWNFYSIEIFFKTLFSPFKRLDVKTKNTKAFDIESFFSALVTSFIMRLVGFFFRIAVILFGLLSILILIIGAIILFFIWLFLPFIIVFIFFVSLKALFDFKKI